MQPEILSVHRQAVDALGLLELVTPIPAHADGVPGHLGEVGRAPDRARLLVDARSAVLVVFGDDAQLVGEDEPAGLVPDGMDIRLDKRIVKPKLLFFLTLCIPLIVHLVKTPEL